MIAPSAGRNREPILAVLRSHLPDSGVVLEIASGTGEHVAYFAAELPGLVFQPSDVDPTRKPSIDAWASGIGNVRPALTLDVAAPWPSLVFNAVLCINMIHIAPWSAAESLMRGAAGVLAPSGLLILYGPYRRAGRLTASNEAFDAELRERNPAWGVRDLEAVVELAAAWGFAAPEIIEMPANNLCVIFRRMA